MSAEWEKTFSDKLLNGFFKRYMSGFGLDIGYAGYTENKPILETATGIDKNYPGYNGVILPFPDNSQDYVFSSHTLEHMEDPFRVIREWRRVVKPQGHIITIVPHRDLYEKRFNPPSIFNPDHKRFYTPAGLLREFEQALPPNSFRVRHLQDNDKGHDYSQLADEHSKGCYEIELVIQKRI